MTVHIGGAPHLDYDIRYDIRGPGETNFKLRSEKEV